MAREIEHIIVLMLENRSFDHMLGFLNHSNPDFPTIQEGDFSNSFTNSDGDIIAVPVNNTATLQLATGPDHSHEAIKEQLENERGGFVSNYYKRLKDKKKSIKKDIKRAKEKLAVDQAFVDAHKRMRPPGGWTQVTKVKGQIKRLNLEIDRLQAKFESIDPDSEAGRVMACFSEDKVPVLSTLAKEFAVFTRWHSSVPGETWPNRAFAHAASSDGKVNIVAKFYTNPTIFEALSDAFENKPEKEQERAWAIYHDGPAHLWAYRKLHHAKGDNFRQLDRLFNEIENYETTDPLLPRYSFVEPNHGLKLGPLFKKRSQFSNNQHPSNNAKGIRDFVEGERLIATIYNKLKGNPALFEKTLFLVTYDEHGGFFDHVEPPDNVSPPEPGLGDEGFNFKSLGARVPAVLVSPFIAKGTLDQEPRDHASIPRTVREVFIKNSNYLTPREEWAKPFHDILNLDVPRALPEVTPLSLEEAREMEGISADEFKKMEKEEMALTKTTPPDLDNFQESLLGVSVNMEIALDEMDESETSIGSFDWDEEEVEEAKSRIGSARDLASFAENISKRVQEK